MLVDPDRRIEGWSYAPQVEMRPPVVTPLRSYAPQQSRGGLWGGYASCAGWGSLCAERERVLYGQPTGPNPLNHRDDFSRPALRHGSLHSLFHVA